MKKSIKYLIESEFQAFNPMQLQDDELGISAPKKTLNVADNSDLKSLFIDYLAVNTKYQIINPSEDFPLVYENIPNEEYFVAPRTNYTLQKLGPRKRKRFPIEWFYHYTVKLEDDGIVIFYNYYKAIPTQKRFNLSVPLYNFIKHADFYRIKSLNFRYWDSFDRNVGKNEPMKIVWKTFDYLDTISIFKDVNDDKFSQSYINNFPEEINPKPLPEYAHITDKDASAGLLDLRNYQFKDMKDYLWFVEKLINIGFSIKDKDDTIYNADNIKELTTYKTSGQEEIDKQNAADSFNQKAIEFISKRFDNETLQKFNKVVNHVLLRNKNCYLYHFNIRSKNGLNYKSTVAELAKANNIFTTNDLIFSPFIKGSILYKMFCIMDKYKLKSYKKDLCLDDCMYGYEEESRYGDSFEKTVDLKDLPIKFNTNPINALYILYFTIGLAIKQCKGIEQIEDSIEKSTYTYYSYGYEHEREAYASEPVKKYNENISDISDFNFDFLDEQIKNCINHYCKKNKI